MVVYTSVERFLISSPSSTSVRALSGVLSAITTGHSFEMSQGVVSRLSAFARRPLLIFAYSVMARTQDLTVGLFSRSGILTRKKDLRSVRFKRCPAQRSQGTTPLSFGIL